MNKMWIAAVVLGVVGLTAAVRADDPNPEIAKTIQDIAARRAEKDAAQVRQVETWAKGESRERGGTIGGGGFVPGGAMPNPQLRKQ